MSPGMGNMTDSDGSRGSLYIVATPIGNLEDISFRALKILNSVDYIASEDTRISGKLLSRYEIKTRLTSYYEHNEKTKAPKIIDDITNGKSVALITDAGTPLISDPGYRLVDLAVRNGIDIIPIPGPSSVLAALSVSGFPTDSFCFEGYPPRTAGKLKRFFENLKNESRTIVLFESPHRVRKSLAIMLDVLGDREIFVGRELTKKFEEKIRGRLGEILAYLEKKTPKGELVIIVRGRVEG
jgi:16S rRNA (cytidine1402-2'-O)-methyltransferase